MFEEIGEIGTGAVFLLMVIIELINGVFFHSDRKKDDWIIDITSILSLAVLVKPGIVWLTATGLGLILPRYDGALGSLPLWIGIVLVLPLDSLLDYWYHRKAHDWDWLWKLHRAHHTATRMTVAIVFRQNIFYYVLSPSLLFSSVMVYLGLGKIYVFYFLIIGLLEVLNHSHFRWDNFLYRYKILAPIRYLLQRTITLPLSHYAHHGIDENGAPKGNFATSFIIWDVLFGTAFFPQKTPLRFGIESDPGDPWFAQLFWPIFKSTKANSEISPARRGAQ